MRKILASLIMVIALLIPLYSFAHTMIFSGDDFINIYKSDVSHPDHSRAFAYGFVNGAFLQLLAVIHLKTSTHQFDCWDNLYKISAMNLQQVVRVFNNYLATHPRDTRQPAIELFDASILSKFPVHSGDVMECVKMYQGR